MAITALAGLGFLYLIGFCFLAINPREDEPICGAEKLESDSSV